MSYKYENSSGKNSHFLKNLHRLWMTWSFFATTGPKKPCRCARGLPNVPCPRQCPLVFFPLVSLGTNWVFCACRGADVSSGDVLRLSKGESSGVCSEPLATR